MSLHSSCTARSPDGERHAKSHISERKNTGFLDTDCPDDVCGPKKAKTAPDTAKQATSISNSNRLNAKSLNMQHHPIPFLSNLLDSRLNSWHQHFQLTKTRPKLTTYRTGTLPPKNTSFKDIVRKGCASKMWKDNSLSRYPYKALLKHAVVLFPLLWHEPPIRNTRFSVLGGHICHGFCVLKPRQPFTKSHDSSYFPHLSRSMVLKSDSCLFSAD